MLFTLDSGRIYAKDLTFISEGRIFILFIWHNKVRYNKLRPNCHQSMARINSSSTLPSNGSAEIEMLILTEA